ncbi:glycosyltransferase [Brevundimonas sp. VNH65]|uniref:glycosyltransferase n=1 Tax=Brevundimonas sp. VNH65 TaxID=3400917 RepID=UPI003C05358A
MKTRRPLVPLVQPAVAGGGDASGPTPAPLEDLARRVANMAARLETAEAALTQLHRREDERLAREAKAVRRPPRPLRVLRKRLRAAGLWPDDRRGGVEGAVVLAEARRNVPPRLRTCFDSRSPYQAWIEANVLTDEARADLEAVLAGRTDLPRISIVTPVHDTPPEYLRAMAASVRNQIFQDWELCLADDAGTSPITRAVLDEIAASDPRIKLVRRPTNGGISLATNSAAALATGEVLLFLDHDDLITPDCLAWFALHYADEPETDLAYSDDDKIGEDGDRYAPQFKPDWSPTLLLNYMYMSHALTVRRDLFEALGGFHAEYDGSQDYEFALRATERARKIGHISRVLYHWRAAHGSTARSGAAKPHSFEAGRKAVQGALDRRGIEARAIHPDWAREASVGMFSLVFPDSGPRVTIVIPTWNRPELLRRCVDSIQATRYADYDVLVADNGSDDPTALSLLAEIAARPNHRVVRIPRRPEGFSFSAVVNQAVRHARGEFILFLNNDTEVRSPQWLSQMVGHARMADVGAVGARLLFEDGSIQHAGIVHGLNDGLVGHAFRHAAPHDWGYMGFVRTSREYSAVTAACLLTPRALFNDLGGFDETDFAVAYNDVDYGFRLAERGLRSIYCAEAELLHLEGKSRGYVDNPRETANLRRIYGDWRDPYFNPNLSLDNENFLPAARRLPRLSSAPVRVVAVTHNLSPEGAPNTLFDLISGLKAAGIIDPVILSPRDGPLRADYEALGIEVRMFAAPPADPGGFENAVDRLSGLFDDLGAEVVMVNTLQMFFAVTAAAQSGVASIWAQHESEPWPTYFDYLAPEVRGFAYAAFGQTYRMVFVADATRRVWAGVQTRHSAQTIRHGVPPWRLAEETGRWTREQARAALGVEPGEKVLVLAGTVCRRKGQLDLAQALSDPGLTALGTIRTFMAGAQPEPDYAALVQDAINALSPSLARRTVLTGPVDDMTVYYAAADIVVCTSRLESAPRVLIEAMAFSRAIVTTPVFGVPELVDENVNALFYAPGDTAALARRLVELLGDDGRRGRMGALGPEVLASRPGYAEMLDQYGRLFREAADLGAFRR